MTFCLFIRGWVGWTAAFFKPTVQKVRCTSVRAGKTLTIQDYVLASADELRIRFRVCWPRAPFCRARHVQVSVAVVGSGGNPNAAGTADLSRDPLEQAARRDLKQLQARQSVLGRMTRVRVRFHAARLEPGEQIELAIHDQRHGTLVGLQHFTVIDEEQAQTLRLKALKAEARQLWIQNRNYSYQGELMAETSDSVSARFTVRNSEPSELLPALQASIDWSLVAGDKRTELGSQPVTLDLAPVCVASKRIPIKDTSLFPTAGSYGLVASVAGRPIAEYSFELLSHQEWLRQLKVEGMDLMAETADGQITPEPGAALRWGTHVAFWPSLRLHAIVPDPSTPLKFTARLARGPEVLNSEEFTIQFDEIRRQVRLERFELLKLGRVSGAKRVHLSLSMDLGDQTLAAWPIVILPAETLTNFEGQLRGHPDDLPLDEEVYEEILAQLSQRRSRSDCPR